MAEITDHREAYLDTIDQVHAVSKITLDRFGPDSMKISSSIIDAIIIGLKMPGAISDDASYPGNLVLATSMILVALNIVLSKPGSEREAVKQSARFLDDIADNIKVGTPYTGSNEQKAIISEKFGIDLDSEDPVGDLLKKMAENDG